MAQHYGNEAGYVSYFFSLSKISLDLFVQKNLVIYSLNYVKQNHVHSMDSVCWWFSSMLIQQGNEGPDFLPTLALTKLHIQVTDKCA